MKTIIEKDGVRELHGVGCGEPNDFISHIERAHPELKGMCFYDVKHKCLNSTDSKQVQFYYDRHHGILEIYIFKK